MNEATRIERQRASQRRYRERHPEYAAHQLVLARIRRGGHPTGRPPVPFADRVWLHVQKTETCWLWAGARDRDGYGQTSVLRRPKKAHRAVYEMLVGPIPEGMQLDHLCRVPACVNPTHLEPVAATVNFARGTGPKAGGRRNAAKTHCPRGHEYTAANTRVDKDGRRHCKACHG